MEYKRSVITPIFTHLGTLQQLKGRYIGTSWMFLGSVVPWHWKAQRDWTFCLLQVLVLNWFIYNTWYGYMLWEWRVSDTVQQCVPQAEKTKFHSENSPILTSLPTSNVKPIVIFEAELGSATCLQSSTTCHLFSFSCFEEMGKFLIFHSSLVQHD